MPKPITRVSKRSITLPKGFQAGAGTCGIKPSGKSDLAVIASDALCPAAGVFTRNKVLGEPVKIAQRHLRGGMLRGVVINSGVANVATGKQGMRDALDICGEVAEALGCKRSEIAPCSTGVIGPMLPMGKIIPKIAPVVSKLSRGPKADAAAAQAILTTDLVAKTASRSVTISGKRITIGGICKGSGMIAPNLATMLAFITTDAAIDPAMLKQALSIAASASFNRVSVDTDTSTSDSVIIMASGRAGNRKISRPGKAMTQLVDALTALCQDLAYQLVCDGEGATRVFRVRVSGAKDMRDADRIGKSIAESPLVKTAVHGSDPNWGRLAMAVGKSGASINPVTLALRIGGVCVFQEGMPALVQAAAKRRLARAMKQREIVFDITVGQGEANCEWLGCDLSRDYIRINAEYTT